MIRRMNHPLEQVTYRVQMETRQWLSIDSTMDNEVSTEAQDGDPHDIVDLGMSIRQAGWDQIPGWPQHVEGFRNWPPPGQLTTMILTGAQWGLVVSTLECWADVSESIDRADEAEQSRAIAALTRVQLAEQGWSPR
jgi:hypothetical protein